MRFRVVLKIIMRVLVGANCVRRNSIAEGITNLKSEAKAKASNLMVPELQGVTEKEYTRYLFGND